MSNIFVGVLFGVSAFIHEGVAIASLGSLGFYQFVQYFKTKNWKGVLSSNAVLFILLTLTNFLLGLEALLMMIPNIFSIPRDFFVGFSYFIYYYRVAFYVSVSLSVIYIW
jgi:hypothetical protein